jgi:glycosyltransferase involved in cell wall biosynthesis
MYDMPTAIRALALLRQRVPGARLTIAGSGPERSSLEALVRELGLGSVVAFPGRLESEAMARLYRGADLMLNPSLVDNMPNSLLEALASGIPVVSTDIGGIRFLVDDGNTALLVPPGEPRAMAAAAERVLSEPGLAARLVRNGLAQVQRYAWPSVRELWLGAYRDVTASGATMSHSRGGGA